jgi:hypothetical protein
MNDQSLGAFAKLLQATVSFVISVCLSVSNISSPTGRIFIIFDFFFNLSRKVRFRYSLARIVGNSPKDLCTFMMSSGILLSMKNVSERSCRENQNTFHFQSIFFSRKIVSLMR